MKRDKIIYWVTTGIIVMVMIFSIFKMYDPTFDQMGFPHYLRTELVVAKILGLLALVIPQIPLRVKEWAYAGFAIVLVSACVAHFNLGDPSINAVEPLGFLVILAVSNIYYHKIINV